MITLTCKTEGCDEVVGIETPPWLTGVNLEQMINICRSCGATCDKCASMEQTGADARIRESRRLAAIDISGIPEALTHWDRAKGNVELMDWVASNRSGGLFLASMSGKNKTRVLAKAAVTMIQRNEIQPSQVKFWRMVDLRKELIGLARDGDHRREKKFLKALGSVELLIIDDIDKVEYTGATAEMLYNVIDARAMAYPIGRLWISANSGGRAMVRAMTSGDSTEMRAKAILSRINDLCSQAPESLFAD